MNFGEPSNAEREWRVRCTAWLLLRIGQGMSEARNWGLGAEPFITRFVAAWTPTGGVGSNRTYRSSFRIAVCDVPPPTWATT